jgi:hypothetical protein
MSNVVKYSKLLFGFWTAILRKITKTQKHLQPLPRFEPGTSRMHVKSVRFEPACSVRIITVWPTEDTGSCDSCRCTAVRIKEYSQAVCPSYSTDSAASGECLHYNTYTRMGSFAMHWIIFLYFCTNLHQATRYRQQRITDVQLCESLLFVTSIALIQTTFSLSDTISELHTVCKFDLCYDLHNITLCNTVTFYRNKLNIHIYSCLSIMTNKHGCPTAYKKHSKSLRQFIQ